MLRQFRLGIRVPERQVRKQFHDVDALVLHPHVVIILDDVVEKFLVEFQISHVFLNVLFNDTLESC